MLRFFTTIILVLAGLAWGILGATGYNVISRSARILGIPALSRVIYSIMGMAAVVYLLKFFNKESFLPDGVTSHPEE